jgi:hypothetical protein
MRVCPEKLNIPLGNAISVATNLLTFRDNWWMGWATH